MQKGAAPGPEGWQVQWRASASWSSRAARFGPLRYSDLGERRLPPPPVDLAGWLVDAVDQWWEEAGRPDPYVLAVVSGDDGSLAQAVLGLGPACLAALRYVMVDPEAETPEGDARGETASTLIALERPAFLFPARKPAEAQDGAESEDLDPDDPPLPARGVGPLVTRLGGLPVFSDLASFRGAGPAGVVVAVEVLSRLPYDLVELAADGSWCEVRLAGPDVPGDGELEEVVVPLDPERIETLPEPVASTGRPGRYAVQNGAARWLRGVLSSTPAGVVAVVDRWAEDGTVPQPSLAFDQLRRVSGSEEISPAPVGGGLSVVTWRAV